MPQEPKKPKDYTNLTEKRKKGGYITEAVDAAAAVADVLIPGAVAIDFTETPIKDVISFLYSLANSPYLPGRNFNIPRLILEYGVYGAAAIIEAIPGLNKLIPSYAIAGYMLDRIYKGYLAGQMREYDRAMGEFQRARGVEPTPVLRRRLATT